MMDFGFSEAKSNGILDSMNNATANIQQFYLGDYQNLGAQPGSTKPNRDLLDFYCSNSQRTDLQVYKDNSNPHHP